MERGEMNLYYIGVIIFLGTMMILTRGKIKFLFLLSLFFGLAFYTPINTMLIQAGFVIESPNINNIISEQIKFEAPSVQNVSAVPLEVQAVMDGVIALIKISIIIMILSFIFVLVTSFITHVCGDSGVVDRGYQRIEPRIKVDEEKSEVEEQQKVPEPEPEIKADIRKERGEYLEWKERD